MILGFTGTRRGMTLAQKQAVMDLLVNTIKPDEVLHGDCVGADDQFANMCDNLVDRPHIVCHPGKSAIGKHNHLRANNNKHDEIHDVDTYIARNRNIVDAFDLLLVVPSTETVRYTGGAWYTYGVAIKQGRPLWIVWPDGTREYRA